MILRRLFSHSFLSLQKCLNSPTPRSILLNSLPKSSFSSQRPAVKQERLEETTKFFVPPPREPYNEKDDVDEINKYVEFPKELYLKLIDEKEEKITKIRSCYYAIERNGQVYHVFDASRMPYGRMCARIAYYLQGKNKPIFTKDQATYGDNCIVVNALNLKITGKKKFKKTIKYHTGFVGHLKDIPIRRFIEEKPEQLIDYCVGKMLPKNKLRSKYLTKLKVFRGEHDMVGFPNFLPANNFVFNPLVHEDPLKKLNKEEDLVVYETHPGDFEELKDFKRGTDPELENGQKEMLPKSGPYNKELLKKYKRYMQVAKRYKEYKFKPKKDNDPRKKDFYIIKSEKQIKRYHLDEFKDFLVEEGDEDEEDDTIK